ncbi:MAG: DNA-3-methyladenine glycosylase [Candidatus Marinimicrobia bacterium]|nr:DNA-3-methyladenine glycosylase [Candidatus Neomarinimicrobiota bacterium]MCF7827599.1 DNA-3-methyladenine glycosylase [Candidatus Neomarinimicrobiota bacterium]MCF7881540.1 DNA-3-methyladenine glycosylase [Candidatus Neomarinimicrobiota bacterium]
MSSKNPIDKSLFQEHPVAFAEKLVGMKLQVEDCTGRIVETEAYTGPPEDLASHAYTRKNSAAEIMQTYGRLYIYSIHGGQATNITCGKEQVGAVLIRAIEPLSGIDLMIRRRSRKNTKISTTWDSNNYKSLHSMLNGPNKLTAALGIRKAWNETPVGRYVEIIEGETPEAIVATPRIGISASTEHRWRFCDADSDFLSRPVTN